MSTQTLPAFTPYAIPAAIRDQVVAAGGQVCQCTGACGDTACHVVGSQFRCYYAGEPGHRMRLIAAPADLGTPEHEIWRIPVGELVAWCPKCWAKGREQFQRERARALTDAQEALFTAPGCQHPVYPPIPDPLATGRAHIAEAKARIAAAKARNTAARARNTAANLTSGRTR